MRRYETVWVVNGDLPDEEVKSTIDKFTGIIASQGGTLINLEEWGRKKLAYKIGNTLWGYYLIADFAGQPDTVKELERNYRIDDRIIRYLTFKKADQVKMEAVEAEIARAREAREAKEAKAAEAAAAAAAAVKAAAAEEAPAEAAPEVSAPPEEPPAETAAPESESAPAEPAEKEE
ncbi:MAG: 30S ribosomal protein S6 [Deltaproteobacteria bacterium]|nr:30S ribosomal protein S6 [Deltaproteobacteria bacterium]